MTIYCNYISIIGVLSVIVIKEGERTWIDNIFLCIYMYIIYYLLNCLILSKMFLSDRSFSISLSLNVSLTSLIFIIFNFFVSSTLSTSFVSSSVHFLFRFTWETWSSSFVSQIVSSEYSFILHSFILSKAEMASLAVCTNVYFTRCVSIEWSIICDSLAVIFSSLNSSILEADCFLCSVGETLFFLPHLFAKIVQFPVRVCYDGTTSCDE